MDTTTKSDRVVISVAPPPTRPLAHDLLFPTRNL